MPVITKVNPERLQAAAILRNGEVLERRLQSHWELRAALDPDNPDPRQGLLGDIDGFVTTAGRFVDRSAARDVAIAAGQIGPMWKSASRPLLSSDIDW